MQKPLISHCSKLVLFEHIPLEKVGLKKTPLNSTRLVNLYLIHLPMGQHGAVIEISSHLDRTFFITRDNLGLVPSYDYEFGTDDYDITDKKPTDFGNALDMYMAESGEPDLYELLDLDKSDLMKNVFQQYFYY